MHEVSRVAATNSYTVCPQSSAAVWCGAVLGCTIQYCTVCERFSVFSYTVETNRLQIQSIAVVWSQRFNLCECVLSKKPKQQSFRSFLQIIWQFAVFFRLILCFIYFHVLFALWTFVEEKREKKEEKKNTKILFKSYQYNLILFLHSKCISVVNTLFYENNF